MLRAERGPADAELVGCAGAEVLGDDVDGRSELEEERARRKRVEERARDMLEQVLSRVDAALEMTEGPPDPSESPSPPPSLIPRPQ